MKKELEIYIDGACLGNPGEAAVGAVFYQNKEKIKEISQTIGQATNNIAEYSAFIAALKEAVALKADKIKIYTDSGLLFNQVTGNYQIKNERLKLLFEEAKHLGQDFSLVEMKQIPREQNQVADELASKALKKRQAKMVAFPFFSGREESPSSKG